MENHTLILVFAIAVVEGRSDLLQQSGNQDDGHLNGDDSETSVVTRNAHLSSKTRNSDDDSAYGRAYALKRGGEHTSRVHKRRALATNTACTNPSTDEPR